MSYGSVLDNAQSQIEAASTYHHLMPVDDEYGTAVDDYGTAVGG